MQTQCSPQLLLSGQGSFAMPKSKRIMQFRYPLPYGAVVQDDGVQFVVYSRSATAMRVLLYRRVSDREPSQPERRARVVTRFGESGFAAEIVPVFPVGRVGRYRLARVAKIAAAAGRAG